MRVAIVSPYYKESLAWLEECHASVRAQTHSCTHIMVADGFARPEIDGWTVQHLKLPCSHGEGGDFPRSTGALSAIRQGFDAIAFLDADNWLYPDHVEHMIHLHHEKASQVCVAARTMHRLDGSSLDRGEPFQNQPFYDANCITLTRPAFFIAHIWSAVPPEVGCISDRIVSMAINVHRLRIARGEHPTVSCRTAFKDDYIFAGEAPPPEAKTVEQIKRASRFWDGLPDQTRRKVLGLSAIGP